jgi:hypothetical protein
MEGHPDSHSHRQSCSHLLENVPPTKQPPHEILFLQQFNCRVEHVRGAENYLADFLSRHSEQPNLENQRNPRKCATIQVFRVNVTHELLKKTRKINQDEQVEWRVLKETLL